MFVCDILDSIGSTLDGFGVFEVPFVGNVLEQILIFWIQLLGCR